MYSMKQASELVGLPVVTIRAWENRYGVISPSRSEGGHRLLSDDDLSTLRYLKRKVEQDGLKISDAVRQLKSKSRIVHNDTEKPTVETDAYDSLINKLYTELIHFRAAQADEAIDLAFALFRFEEALQRVIAPVLYRTGEAWEAGHITVAQEHFASETIMRRLSAFFRIFPVIAGLPVVLALCPEGERHHLGLMMFSLFLRKRGAEVLYLGADTPFNGLAEMIRSHGVSYVAISVTDKQNVDRVHAWIDGIREIFPKLRFLLGGAAFSDAAAQPAKAYIRYLAREEWEDWQGGFFEG
ncbi:MerR family transcriptional regulator [Paenibacillus whitsoniae]|uniref:MerR family transcriptional regulator n=1 Tax=Paenibacillus whitsoniae TaxID=2496558 RepID=A0A430JJU4_9BACL|nr:B12-binding domain-containing protein [Paenibacillus whitsoniae]RTE11377.1 MerR family transcriptional regulator [Paenibacillus whitsoniae]